jgi:hypothetical protein
VFRSQWSQLAAGLGGTYINKQVFPQAPSPTMTSFRRISAMMVAGGRLSDGTR